MASRTRTMIAMAAHRVDDMEEVKRQLRQLNSAVFGNPDDPHKQPGLLMEISHLDHNVKAANETLRGMRGDIRKGVWIVLAAVLSAVLALVLKH